MSLTVKHLNGDASFLLSFSPAKHTFSNASSNSKAFHVLLDPWITGPSTILHPKISNTTHRQAACISSLRELPEPDVVIISQNMPDHCNEATLKQLPRTGTKTVIVAETAAARTIRGLKHFDQDKIRVIPKWEEPRVPAKESTFTLSIPPLRDGGSTGMLTVAYIPQQRDMSGLHAAVGITYQPPPDTTLESLNRQVPSSTSLAVERPLSVLFAPHGIAYSSLHSYASHLEREGTLPLTALLHCFDIIQNPWWLGGNILLGAPAGIETARRLSARVWISAHDGDKEVKGLANGWLRTQIFGREDVVSGLAKTDLGKGSAQTTGIGLSPGSEATTEVIRLGAGREVTLSIDGVQTGETTVPGLDERGP